MCEHKNSTKILAAVTTNVFEDHQVAYCDDCNRLIDYGNGQNHPEGKPMNGQEVAAVFDAIYDLVSGVDESMLEVHEAVEKAMKGLNP